MHVCNSNDNNIVKTEGKKLFLMASGECFMYHIHSFIFGSFDDSTQLKITLTDPLECPMILYFFDSFLFLIFRQKFLLEARTNFLLYVLASRFYFIRDYKRTQCHTFT